jgi:putative FmdB family regulatory protein
MPIYDYKCEECQKIYDVFHKVREVEEDVVCPSCGSTKHTRLISAPMVRMGNSTSSSHDAPPSCADGNCCGGSCGLN